MAQAVRFISISVSSAVISSISSAVQGQSSAFIDAFFPIESVIRGKDHMYIHISWDYHMNIIRDPFEIILLYVYGILDGQVCF